MLKKLFRSKKSVFRSKNQFIGLKSQKKTGLGVRYKKPGDRCKKSKKL